MEFAPRSQKAKSASNFDPAANKPGETETFYSKHMIAKPLALKSMDHIEMSTHQSAGQQSPGDAWTVGGHRLPKKLRIGRDPEMMNSAIPQRITAGFESFGNSAADQGTRNDLALVPSDRQMNDSRSPQITPSVVGSSDPLKAPPAVQAYAMQPQVTEKRSAFREVTKRHKTSGQGRQTCANGTQHRPRDGREPQIERLRNDFNFSSLEVAANRQSVPSRPFYDTTQQFLTMHSISGITHHNSSAVEHEDSNASSFHFLKRRPPVDFPNRTPECVLRKNTKNNTGLSKETYALQFGSFQNGAHADQFPPLPFPPWQQSLVPTSVLPLSPNVPGRQYDNLCAKCNASFRMTSDLVYHMRTQHKRSSDGTTGGAPNPPSTIGTAVAGFRGKRAEEKLKCERCGETFRERHHLTRHMTSHNSDHEST